MHIESLSGTYERMVEWTFESRRHYADPFNDVVVDVLVERDGQRWKVPAFWRGGSYWSVRFAPPKPGTYAFRVESSDRENSDLNGRDGRIIIAPYKGSSPVLERGMVRVSANHRHFEHADGTPFYWLGDTWWTGLSDRLPWEGFQRLVLDRKAKGFTVVQICVGLIPSNEEQAPSDPGFCNEGGCAWEPGFARINPRYFDYADRRIQCLVDNGIVPVIVGGWRQVLAQMGVGRMQRHWRYVIARYGAYPVLWLAGGEVYDPPESHRRTGALADHLRTVPGEWTEVVRFIRAVDPYHHPVSVHEVDPPYDSPLQDETLTDFDLFQAGHRGWPSIATAVALLNKHYARTTITKPLVVGEIGYERMAGENHEDYQRAAFWLTMLNGAAGFTYGNISTAEAYSVGKPPQRRLMSSYTWEEGMHFPGSTQIGLGAKLLKTLEWWRMVPHPEWVVPSGTTLLEPNGKVNGFDIDLVDALERPDRPRLSDLPLGEWHDKKGDWRLPYAAGVPGEFRVIYLPYSRFSGGPAPKIAGLEAGVRYHVQYWEPALGIYYPLGMVERAADGGDKIELGHWDRKLYDAEGQYRGELRGSCWEDYGSHQRVIDGTYETEVPPTVGDWILVMKARR